MAPLRRQWQEVQIAGREIRGRAPQRHCPQDAQASRKKTQVPTEQIDKTLHAFMEHLASVRILDPACGSGNFLYVAIQSCWTSRRRSSPYAAGPEIRASLFPTVRPTQLHGIEINPYAAELAQVVIWIGYLQWMRDNGWPMAGNPILDKIQTIEKRDAILDLSNPKLSVPAEWPQADFIIGNPPFLGSKLFRKYDLSDDYVDRMYRTYDIPKTSDLCCYWFEQARGVIQRFPGVRVGLLATQGIRGGDNRTVLERIKKAGDIFMAWSDKEWVLDGAAVHVSIIGFDGDAEKTKTLDGQTATAINADLSSGTDAASAVILAENRGIAYMGDTKGGAFDISYMEARNILGQPNPNGMNNSQVLFPWINGADLTKRSRGMWIIDFGCSRNLPEASGFEAPMRILEERVKPERLMNRRASYAERWWIHVEPRPEMREPP